MLTLLNKHEVNTSAQNVSHDSKEPAGSSSWQLSTGSLWYIRNVTCFIYITVAPKHLCYGVTKQAPTRCHVEPTQPPHPESKSSTDASATRRQELRIESFDLAAIKQARGPWAYHTHEIVLSMQMPWNWYMPAT